jgi:SAM-dependent methyltransferase
VTSSIPLSSIPLSSIPLSSIPLSSIPLSSSPLGSDPGTIDQAALDDLMGRFTADFAAALHAATVLIGDKLGLYRALADLGPSDAAALAKKAGCDRRLVQEWLDAQYVSGYCERDPATGAYRLSPEQAAVLADPGTPAYLIGAMSIAAAVVKDEDKITRAFRDGGGLGWHDHHDDLFHGTERLFRPGYVANLVSGWIPALDGMEARLRTGARIADLGCGHGASTLLLAEAYPASTVVGFDNHAPSIEMARRRATEAGLSGRVRFEVASAQDFPGSAYDLVCVFDALHDMGDPAGAAGHIRAALAPEGTLLLVEPMAGDDVTANVNVVGRIFYSASTLICTPSAQSQGGRYTLGAQVPDATWAAIMAAGGLTRFRRATETPFNRVFEVRP